MKRAPDGDRREQVAALILANPEVSDAAVSAEIGCSEQAVGALRRSLGIPGAYQRRRTFYRPDGFLYRCQAKHRFVWSETLTDSVTCPTCQRAAYLRTCRVVR